ncbi:hypothetical protein ADL01_02340 [Streptomyces sp. NRRL WC-3618]|nr:hypothetical protein ADL01_02340 [Streptomyces sp. NRRL WC-3618]
MVGARHGAAALLEDVGEFMSDGAPVKSAWAGDDVFARGVGVGVDGRCGAFGSWVGVDPYGGEVGPEAGLHLPAQ